MGTYGRYTLLCESLACFLAQTALEDATLLIYNQHPIPLYFDHPRVRVVNMQNPPGTTFRDIRSKLVALAREDAEYLHFWDDDDLYLPWHLEDGLNNIGNHMAWKANSNWILTADGRYERTSNMFEATWFFQADYLRNAPLDTFPEDIEIPVFRQTVEDKCLATTELSGRANYIYRWAIGQVNCSGLSSGGSAEKQRQTMRFMQSQSNDVRENGMLEAVDLTPRWKHYLAGTKSLVTQSEWEANRSALGLADFDPSTMHATSKSAMRLLQRFNPFGKTS